MELDFRKLGLWIEKKARDQVQIDRMELEWKNAGRPPLSGALGSTLAFIEPELHEHFPDSESVNRALRSVLGIAAAISKII